MTSNPLRSADSVLDGVVDGLGPDDAAVVLATLISRGATRLHNLARTEAAARKEQPEWPVWAQLQNATRALVLQASTCRDLAARLHPQGRKE